MAHTDRGEQASPSAGQLVPARQVIPRPDVVLPGSGPPWAGRTTVRSGVTLARVVDALRAAGRDGTVPVEPVWEAGELERHPAMSTADPRMRAAVLVALFEEDGETRVVLTRRSRALRDHRGQVSFPGGRIDQGEDSTSAALREAEEEVGLARSSVDVVGWLGSVRTVGSDSVIIPIVGRLPARPDLVPNPGEVARAFDVPLAGLMAEGVFHQELWTVPDGSRTFPVAFFEIDGETVWGATARMLLSLLGLLIAERPTAPPAPGGPAGPLRRPAAERISRRGGRPRGEVT